MLSNSSIITNSFRRCKLLNIWHSVLSFWFNWWNEHWQFQDLFERLKSNTWYDLLFYELSIYERKRCFTIFVLYFKTKMTFGTHYSMYTVDLRVLLVFLVVFIILTRFSVFIPFSAGQKVHQQFICCGDGCFYEEVNDNAGLSPEGRSSCLPRRLCNEAMEKAKIQNSRGWNYRF